MNPERRLSLFSHEPLQKPPKRRSTPPHLGDFPLFSLTYPESGVYWTRRLTSGLEVHARSIRLR